MLVFAIDDMQSFERVEKNLDKIKRLPIKTNIPCIILGNKLDLDRQFKRVVKGSQGIELAKKYNIPYLESSARSNMNIKQSIDCIKSCIEAQYKSIDPTLKKTSYFISDFAVKAKEELLIPGRTSLRESIVFKLSKTNQKKERHLFLFNDYLVYGKPKGGISVSQCIHAIPLYNVILLDGKYEKDHFTLKVIHLDEKKTLEFLFNSQSEKNDWIDAIEQALINYRCDERRLSIIEDIEKYQVISTNTKKTNKRLFGVPLKYLIKKQSSEGDNPVPLILHQLLGHLGKEGNIKTVGLFRLPGSFETVIKMRQIYNSGRACSLDDYTSVTLASLLLLFLKQMPTSLVPVEFNESLFHLEGTTVAKMAEFLTCIPTYNYTVLHDLLFFLNRAISFSRYNKLSLDIAAKTFASVVIRCKTSEIPTSIQMMKMLIQNCHALFSLTNRRTTTNLQLAPEFLVQINTKKTKNCLETYKSKLLDLFSLVKCRGSRDMELGSGLQSIIITINSLLSYDVAFVQRIVDMTYFNQLDFLIQELEKILTLTKKGGISSKSIRLGHSEKTQISAIQSQLQADLEEIYIYLDSQSNWTSDERIAYFKIKKELERNLQMKKSIGVEENTTFDELMARLNPIFSDKDARIFWDTNFGLEKFIVEKDIFISALSENELNKTDKDIISKVLDPYHAGTVTIFDFAQLLSGLGPIKNCISNVLKMTKETWFYGFITHNDVLRLLELERPGSFLVRFTTLTPGLFTIEYVVSNPLYPRESANEKLFEVKSVNILNTPKGFQLDEYEPSNLPIKRDNQCILARKESIRIVENSEIYPSIDFLLQRNSLRFCYVFESTLYRNVWFHGNLTSSETLQQLHDKPEGTFLVRFSTEVGCLTCSFVCRRGNNMSIEHFRLERHGLSVKQGSKTYSTIEECIEANKKWLTTPFEKERNHTSTPTFQDGTIEKIIEKLYDGSDFSATTVFLLTYRSFATPNAIIYILRERFHYYKSMDSKKHRLRIGNFLKVWIQEYFWDIKDDKEFLRSCRALIDNIVADHSMATFGKQLQALLHKQIEGYEERKLREESKPMRVDRVVSQLKDQVPMAMSNSLFGEEDDDSSDGDTFKSPSPVGSGKLDSVDFMGSGSLKLLSRNNLLSKSKKNSDPKSVLDLPIHELAPQITLIEEELFVKIATFEFLNQGWLKSDKEKRSPNLLKMIRFSNRIARWVVTEVLVFDKVPMRVKVMEYFITLAMELIKLGNYNAVLEIVAGLGSSAIGRLKKTWSAFSKSKKKQEYDEIQELLSTDQNWIAYRTAFNNSAPPKIPYLGLILTDLVFVEDGNPDRLPNGHLNWTKCEKIAEVLHHVQLCQQEKYKFEPNPSVIDVYLFETVNPMTIDEAYKRSLIVEPRNSAKKHE